MRKTLPSVNWIKVQRECESDKSAEERGMVETDGKENKSKGEDVEIG